MLALTLEPGHADSLELEDIGEPPLSDGAVLARTLVVGICGTDRDLVRGEHGAAPADARRLVIGHESLGEVLEAPSGSGFARGDRIVGIVRRPDPEPCPSCAAGRWDMCTNGRYSERGIVRRHGYAAERFRVEPEFAVLVSHALGERAVLLEPASVVAKAWELIDHAAARAEVAPQVALITGAGSIGLLAALLGRQRGLEVHVLDRASEGVKPALVRELGAHYRHDDLAEVACRADVIIECTGAGELVLEAMQSIRPSGIVCLVGLASAGRAQPLDLAALNRELVLANKLVFGTVNAAPRHYEAAERALCLASAAWLERLISRRVPARAFAEALVRRPNDVKVVVAF
jgi:glucose 1-dehydrogenase